MTIKEIQGKGWSGYSVEKPTTAILLVYITVPIFKERLLQNDAILALYTDVVLSGAGNYGRSDFLHALDLLGSSIKVTQTATNLTFTVSCTSETTAATMALLSTMLKEPHISLHELKRAQKTLANKRPLLNDNARQQAATLFKRSLFSPNSASYVYTVDQVIDTSAQVTKNALTTLHKQVMSSTWLVTVAGQKRAIKTVLTTLEQFDRAIIESSDVSDTLQNQSIKRSKPDITYLDLPSKQNLEFSLGATLPLSQTDSELPAFIFGLAVLGKWGGFSGRLMSTVREKEGLTYGIYAEVGGTDKFRTGYWRIMTFFAPKDVAQGLSSTLREINLISRKGITAEEFKKFKTIIKTSFTLENDSLQSLSARLHTGLVGGISLTEQTTLQNDLLQVSQAEVNAALSKYLNTDNFTIAAAGPIKSCLKALKAFK